MQMNEENPNGTYTTLAALHGELTAITVKETGAGEDLLVYVPTGGMTARAVAALRLAYPTNQIWEQGLPRLGRPGVVIHGVQTQQDFERLQAAHAGADE